MSEEHELLSLSEDTTNDTDNNDDTIKIPRVKLPLNGYIARPIGSNREVGGTDGLKLSLPMNGNEDNRNNGHAVNDDGSSSGNEPGVDVGQGAMNCAPTVAESHKLQPPLRTVARLWKFSRLLCIALLLIPIIAVCFYAYVQLNHSQSNLYTVDAHTGKVLSQQSASGAAQTELVDVQGSIQIATQATNEQQLVALDAHGTVQWHSFISNGAFALPSVHPPSGTVLATLSEQTGTGHSLTLYSFNQATGHINWQYDIGQPAQAQSTDILGADTNFIYAVSSQPLTGQQTQVQLLAINQYTGYIGWRVNSQPVAEVAEVAEVADGNPLDKGSLLLTEHALVWQVNASIQVIDATQGTILWTATLPFSTISTAQQDEAQMVIVHGQLVVERADILYAFDMTTGTKLWNVSVSDFSTGTIPVSIATTGQTLLVYGNGQLEAISVSDQRIIWQQRQMGNILSFQVSNDGTLVYIILLDSVENSTPAQALIALDTQNGAARWTFQPSAQFTFLNPQSNGFQYRQNTILTSICVTYICNHPHLYALNAVSGATLWKFEGNGVSNVLMSNDGSIVCYEGNTSPWQQFIQGLSG